MLRTRFDDAEHWIVASGEMVDIKDLSTPHLVNIYSMLCRRADRIMTMLLMDIESCQFADMIWTADPRSVFNRKESIKNVTSMNEEALFNYVHESPLGHAILREMFDRGVDVENVYKVVSGSNCRC